MNRFAALLLAFGVLVLSPMARAFTHIVRRAEILAEIAERTYGRIQYEKILVAANALDAQGGSPIVSGQRLEVPTVSYHRVGAGETWASIATELLGEPDRATVLAQSNDTVPWIPPAEAAEILVPYNLRYLVGPNENIVTIAQMFTATKRRPGFSISTTISRGKPCTEGFETQQKAWQISPKDSIRRLRGLRGVGHAIGMKSDPTDKQRSWRPWAL